MIITIANQKGGIGKTTTATALTEALSITGYRVLLVDADPQGNATATAHENEGDGVPTLYNVLLGNVPASAAIVSSETLRADIIPSSPELASMETVLKGDDPGRPFRMRETLMEAAGRYDYVIIDTPPSLNILTINALTAARWLLVPTTADMYALTGIAQLYNTVSAVRRYCNPQLEILGILITRHNTRTVVSRELSAAIEHTAEAIGTRVLTPAIREGVAVRGAQAQRVGLYQRDPQSNPALDYKDAAKEILSITLGRD